MRATGTIGLVATLVASACGGAGARGVDAPGSAAPAISSEIADAIRAPMDNLHRRTLANGLEVVVIHAPQVPIVTIEMAVRNGAFTEPPELNGLSHLYEHMFFKANERIPSQEAYLARQRELGMVWNGTTSTERVNYFFTLQQDQLEGGLEFMRDAIRTPIFREDELVREREVVLGEYDRNEANPYYFLYTAMNELLWWAHPSRKDPLGDRETISTATVDQMRFMKDTYYVPNNALLVLSGDVTPEDGFALAERTFGDWERGPDPFEAFPIPEHPPLAGNVARVVPQPVEVSVVQIGWHGPDTRAHVADTYAADILSFIVGQTGSGFQTRLVESGVALEANLSYSTQRFTGPITLTAVTAPGGELEALDALLDEVDRMRAADDFTDDQLRTASTLLSIGELSTRQSTEQLASTVSYWWASANIEYYLTYLDRLAAVRRPDIARYVNRWMIDRPMAVVILGNEDALALSGVTEAAILKRLEER